MASQRPGGENRGSKAARDKRRDSFKDKRRSQRDHKDKAKPTPKPAPKKEEKGVWDSITDWAGEVVEGVGDFFTGKEDTGGFSPMGGPSSYGMTKKKFDKTIGKKRHEARGLGQRLGRQVDYFEEAPLDYVSDLLDNPLVAGAATMMGVGLPAFGVKVVDAAVDLFQGEVDPLGAAANIAAAGLSFTPAGAALPKPVRSVAKAGLKKGVEGATTTIGATLGGKVVGKFGETFADALTDNPLAKAGIASAAAAAGAWGGKTAVQKGLAQGPSTPKGPRPTPSRDHGDRDKVTSPLVASGERAIASSQQLMQDPNVGLYAETVQQLPFYGINTRQQNYYGV